MNRSSISVIYLGIMKNRIISSENIQLFTILRLVDLLEGHKHRAVFRHRRHQIILQYFKLGEINIVFSQSIIIVSQTVILCFAIVVAVLVGLLLYKKEALIIKTEFEKPYSSPAHAHLFNFDRDLATRTSAHFDHLRIERLVVKLPRVL